MICFFCPGVAHPASGAQYAPGVVACRACVVELWAWFRAQQHKRWGGLCFYDYVTPKGQ